MSDKPKILIVEDEPGISMMMTYLLTRAGCDTQTAWNAEKASRLAQTEKFDLVTLDINIPGTSGFEIFQCLKQIPHLKNTPVIFVSGGASGEDRRRAHELGAVDFISKPFEATHYIYQIISHVKVKKPACISEGATR